MTWGTLSVVLFWVCFAIVIATGLNSGIFGRTNPVTGATKRWGDEFIIIAWPLLGLPLVLWIGDLPIAALIVVGLMALYCVGELHRQYFGQTEQTSDK